MKQFFLSLCIFAFTAVHAIDNNVELLLNGDFSGAALVSQANIVATDASGVWIAGDNTKTAFTPSISGTGAAAYFTSNATANAAALYDHFLGQITGTALTTGRYRISLKAKGDQPFYLKISGADATIGTEYSSVVKNTVGTIDRSGAGGYSIKFTPASASTFGTIEADLDITIPTSVAARLFFIFPNQGTVELDDISFKRTGDTPVFSAYYLRPTGDNTSWNNLVNSNIISNEQVLTGSAISIATEPASSYTYYLAKGSYNTTGLNVTSGKIYGGFNGDETSIDINGRAISDLDENGIIEPWEFTNETSIKSSLTNSSFTGTGVNSRLLIVSGNGGEVNGVTLSDYNMITYGGPIAVGKPATTPQPADTVSTLAGTLRFCTIRKIKSAVDGSVLMTNPYSLIDRCLVEGTVNLAGNSGGAINMKYFGGKVEGCVIRNNASAHATAGRGGAIYVSTVATSGNVGIVRNCVIYNNTSTAQGGAIRIDGQAGKRGVQIINCTIANNKSGSGGGSSQATVELLSAGTLVNSIVVNPALSETGTEVRTNSVNSYITNTVYGDSTYTAGGVKSTTMNGKITSDLGFTNPTTFSGVSIEGYTSPWDAAAIANYNAIRKANFKLTSSSSPAIVINGAKSLPANYTTTGTVYTVSLTATIPTTDLMSVSRPVSTNGHLDLGAYQYSSLTTATQSNVSDRAYCLSVDNGILINKANGLNVTVFTVSGQVVKSVKSVSNAESITLPKGVYIVKSDKFIEKVIVR